MNDEKVITIAAVGDIMLGDMPITFGFGVGSQIENNDPQFPFVHITGELKKADIVFGNLETVLSRFDKNKTEFESSVFRGQAQTARGLCQAGFNVLSMANNHIMQHGRPALEETIDALQKNGIGVIGVELLNHHIKNLYLTERNGLRIAFLGYNQRPQQYFLDPPSYVTASLDVIHRDINLIRDNTDIIIVSIHWGDEFITRPSSNQVKLAHKIIDCGANIILGHHPHILQGIEEYHGGIIAYSLGNFVFDMWQERFRKTMILKLLPNKSGKINYEIMPVFINRRYQPLILDGPKGAALKNEIINLYRYNEKNNNHLDYEKNLKRENKRYRLETYWFYLTHLHRYGIKRLISNIVRAMKLRLAGNGSKAK